jgi:hypothetical protein
MAAYLFSRGIVKQGQLHEFVRGVKKIIDQRRKRAYSVPEVLYGLSGPMNTVLLRFSFPDLGKLEQEERELEADPEFARMNAALPYVEGSITYEIYLDDRFGKPDLDPEVA